ncbi:TPA: AMP-binding protein [Burkholderia cepacia]|uniref:AMP-binding protein n=1 Tax=Burkholderia cepacia TaxID=292 RepID=UPI000D2F3AD8|nr:AMP-binding protein [Burkholderia cepacia]MCA8360063.1 AMP-binding protein [Burkholderia cepacia]HDR9762271.1 AMP-binding protein [Burkholderia cepacia ATCC 25416]HDV6370267.1 AMP-binding protein [Burkholderia cepacia]
MSKRKNVDGHHEGNRLMATELLTQAVRANPNGIATIYGKRQRRWSEVGQRVPRMAGALRELGISEGACVAALAFNSDRYIELFFSVPWAGGVLTPLNVRWSFAENKYALTSSETKVLFVDDAFVEQAQQLRDENSSLRAVIYVGDGDTPPGMLSYEQLIDESEPVDDAGRGSEDIYILFYTGGTTAHPKAVVMQHKAVVHAATTYLAMLPKVDTMRYLHQLGFFHVGAATPLWYTTLARGTHVVVPKFDPLPSIHAIAEHRVTTTTLAPTLISMLLARPECKEYDLSSMNCCIYGGSPMPEPLMAKAKDILPDWCFYQIYGMTEVNGFATMLRWSDHQHIDDKSSRLRSAGQPAIGVQIRVVLPDGSEARVRQNGEIAVRSNMLMKEYFGNAQATKEALRDGWMFTGDAGYFDEDGYLYVADRVKDMIRTGEENVFSVDVERVLFQHAAIKEVAVFGVPDEKWGEAVHAVVVLNDGAHTTSEELIEHCRARIGGYKCPRTIEFRTEPLPLTPIGKVRKNVLRDPFWENRSRKI